MTVVTQAKKGKDSDTISALREGELYTMIATVFISMIGDGPDSETSSTVIRLFTCQSSLVQQFSWGFRCHCGC